MSEELISWVNNYIRDLICTFESGIYKMVLQINKDNIRYMSSKHQPFITIFRDLYEKYFTSTYNSLIKRDDEYVIKTFDKLQLLSKHSPRCILNILANLVISIHFNLDRKKLNYYEHDLYIQSLKEEISKLSSFVNINELFDHVCNNLDNSNSEIIPEGEKFITIKITYKSNGVEKEMESLCNEPNNSRKN